jgi:hypothetical protein
VVAKEADVITPINDPVKEPVLICVELETNVGLFAMFV